MNKANTINSFFENGLDYKPRKWILILGLFSFLLYANTIPNDYNLDDELVTINHRLTSKGIAAIPEIFTSSYYEDEMGYSYEYRPVTLSIFAIEHQFFGDNPHVSHFINVLLYMLCCLMVFIVISKLFTQEKIIFPVVVTLLFIVHPMHTEVVASIKNRDEILSLLFGLGSIYTSLRLNDSRKPIFLFFTLFLICFALLSKQSTASFFLIIPLILLFKRISITYFIVTAISCVVTLCSFLYFIGFRQSVICWVGVLLSLAFFFFFFLFNNQLLFSISSQIFRSVNQYLKNWNFPGVETLEFQYSRKLIYWLIFSSCLMLAGIVFGVAELRYLSYIILLLHPFLICEHRFELYVLSSLFLGAVIIVDKYHYSDTIFYLTAAYHFWIYYKSKRSNFIPLIIFQIVVFLLISSNRTSSELLDSSIQVFAFYVLCYIILTGFVSKIFKVITIVLFLLIIITPIIITQVDEVYLVYLEHDNTFYGIVVFLILVYFNNLFIRFTRIITAIILLAVVVGITIEVSPSFMIQNNKSKSSNNQRYTEVLIYDDKKLNNDNNDRPLEYIEYPLEIHASLSEKIGTSVLIMGKYLKMMFIPFPMCFYYGYDEIPIVKATDLKVVFGIFVHLVVLLSSLLLFRRHSAYFFGVVIYLTSIILYSNLVYPIAGMVGDRLTFVSSFGFLLAAGYIFLRLSNNKSIILSVFAKLILAIIVIVFSVLTLVRNKQWKNHLTLYEHDIEYVNKSAQAHNLLAKRLMFESFEKKNSKKSKIMQESAAKHFEKSISIYPDFLNTNFDLGRTYLILGREMDAAELFIKAAELQPDYLEAWHQAGDILIRNNQLDRAKKCFYSAIKADSSDLISYLSLSQIFIIQKKYKEAIEINLKAIKINILAYDPYINLGIINSQINDLDSALFYFEEAYKIKQNDINLLLALANIYKEKGMSDKANFYFARANQLR